MASDKIPGPREPIASDARGGAFQLTALNGASSVRVPDEWRGLHCRIAWSPATAGDKLFFLFVAEDDPMPTIDDATDSSGTPPALAKVDRAPDWVDDGSDDVIPPTFPGASTVLLIESEGAGRFLFRMAEG